MLLRNKKIKLDMANAQGHNLVWIAAYSNQLEVHIYIYIYIYIVPEGINRSKSSIIL